MRGADRANEPPADRSGAWVEPRREGWFVETARLGAERREVRGGHSFDELRSVVPMFLVLGAVFGLLGFLAWQLWLPAGTMAVGALVIATIWAVRALFEKARLRRLGRWHVTQAEVVDGLPRDAEWQQGLGYRDQRREKVPDFRRPLARGKVRYVFRAGHAEVFAELALYSEPSLHEGDAVTVLYDPGEPQRHRVLRRLRDVEIRPIETR